jgi:hypothetical protein
MTKYEVPVAMYVGMTDLLADFTDATWAKEQMGDAVVDFKTYPFGHTSFFIAKDMSYFNDVKDMINNHQ